MKSKYAEYFDIQPRVEDQESQAICLTCGDVLRMPNRSTSALKYHIEAKHGINLDETITAKSESDDISILEPTKSSNLDEHHETSYNNAENSMSRNKPPRKISKSKYAEYFDIQPEENRATCLTCGAILNMTNRNTSTLKYHVETKHGINIEEMSTAKSESDEIILDNEDTKVEIETIGKRQVLKNMTTSLYYICK